MKAKRHPAHKPGPHSIHGRAAADRPPHLVLPEPITTEPIWCSVSAEWEMADVLVPSFAFSFELPNGERVSHWMLVTRLHGAEYVALTHLASHRFAKRLEYGEMVEEAQRLGRRLDGADLKRMLVDKVRVVIERMGAERVHRILSTAPNKPRREEVA